MSNVCSILPRQIWTFSIRFSMQPVIDDNLGPLCRHDHRTKHRSGWKLEQTRPGTYRWTSPLGHTYTTRPDPP